MAKDQLPKDKQKHLKIHITCLDLHFATVARDMILFMFLDQLTDESLDSDTRLEVMTALFYVYMGWLLPSYCYDRFGTRASFQMHLLIFSADGSRL